MTEQVLVARPEGDRFRSVLFTGFVSMLLGVVFFAIPAVLLLTGPFVFPRALILGGVLGLGLGAVAFLFRDLLLATRLAVLTLFATPFYQLALLDSAEGWASWWRILPLVVILPVLCLCYLSEVRYEIAALVLGLAWILLQVPAVFRGVDVVQGSGLFVVFLVIPPLLYGVVKYLFRHDEDGLTGRLVLQGFIITMAGALLSLPLEQDYKNSTALLASRNLSNLNQVIGHLVLLWPLLLRSLDQAGKSVRTLFWALTVAVAVMSYSRGGIVVVAFLAAVTVWRFRIRPLLYLAIAVGLVLLVAYRLDPQFLYFWGLRFNVADASSGTLGDRLAVMLAGDRPEIWRITWEAAVESHFMGIGLGQLSSVMLTATSGMWSFAGSHSMFLTVLTESGLGAALILLFAVLAILSKHIRALQDRQSRWNGWVGLISFACFLIYAHTVGVELVTYSSRIVTPLVVLYLMLHWGDANRKVRSAGTGP